MHFSVYLPTIRCFKFYMAQSHGKSLDRFCLTHSGHGLLWQKWDDAFVLFQPSSAETHFINEISAFILERLAQEPVGLETLGKLIDMEFEQVGENIILETLDFWINRLEELGLIDRVDGISASL